MDNTMKNIVTDQEMYVDGVTLREKRELITESRGSQQESTLIHTRWIGGKLYQVKSVSQNGKVDTTVKTEMTDLEVEVFEQNWQEKWNPQLSDSCIAKAQLAPTSTICPIFKEDICQCAEMIESQTDNEDI